MSGSNPIEANSEVPMANAPSTRANSAARFSRAGLRLGLVALACTSEVISAPWVSELEGTDARCGSELRRLEWPISRLLKSGSYFGFDCPSGNFVALTAARHVFGGVAGSAG